MIRFGCKMIVACALAVFAATPLVAEEPSSDPVNELTNKWVDIGALLSTRYTYSFQRPLDDRIVSRVVDKKDNTFTLDTGSLFFGRDREGEYFGFQLALDFFDSAQYLGSSDGLLEDSDEFEVREAYLTLDVPFGGITLKAGKFVTLLGYEVIKTNTNINHNISHSLLFGFAVPFTHTGILANIPITDMFSFDIGLVNGWDNVEDNNPGKTLLAGLGFHPVDEFSMYAAGTFGPEQTRLDEGGAGSTQTRGVITLNAVFKPIDGTTVVFDSVYGNESRLVPDAVKRADYSAADWYGLALYAVQDVSMFTFALRGEVFYDQIAPLARDQFGGQGDRVLIWEISPTVAIHVFDHFTFRIEYRHDQASDPIFLQEDDSDRGWNTIAAEALVYF
ncbi:MAG TPA: outer membrane beta-barrel protein [Terriglobales bacterium]|nr:outer membrane beta-barrel protein [Terriglobales bacterium]